MSFGDGFIDGSLYELDEELKQIDELLCNAELIKPFEEVFDPSLGRPGATAVSLGPPAPLLRSSLPSQGAQKEGKKNPQESG
jgi:hypothetical protein